MFGIYNNIYTYEVKEKETEDIVKERKLLMNLLYYKKIVIHFKKFRDKDDFLYLININTPQKIEY